VVDRLLVIVREEIGHHFTPIPSSKRTKTPAYANNTLSVNMCQHSSSMRGVQGSDDTPAQGREGNLDLPLVPRHFLTAEQVHRVAAARPFGGCKRDALFRIGVVDGDQKAFAAFAPAIRI